MRTGTGHRDLSRPGPAGSPGVLPAAFTDLAAFREHWRTRGPVGDGADEPTGGWQAATAIVVAPAADHLEFAVIERVHRAGDRWSGQMALPGGKREPGDRDLAETAARETFEEVGLQLAAPLARLPSAPTSAPGVLATYVYTLEERAALRPEPAEVAGAWWMPLPALVDAARRTRLRWSGGAFPGIDHRGRTIWGLTYQTLGRFLAEHDLRLP